jgi:hypothetical protein
MPMTQIFTFTQDDVIRYAYDELSDEENALMEEAMVYDSTLLDFYLDCIDLKAELNQVMLTPPDRAIERVINYSRNYQLRA